MVRCGARQQREHSDMGTAYGMVASRRWLWTSTIAALFTATCLLSSTLAQTSAAWAPSVPGYKITTIPAEFDQGCRQRRAKLYDECLGQSPIFYAAELLATPEATVLLLLSVDTSYFCRQV